MWVNYDFYMFIKHGCPAKKPRDLPLPPPEGDIVVMSFPHSSGGNPGIIKTWMPGKKLRA